MLTMFILSTGKIPKWSVKRKHFQGDVGVPEPRHLPTVRNIVVYGKKKMMKVAIKSYSCP